MPYTSKLSREKKTLSTIEVVGRRDALEEIDENNNDDLDNESLKIEEDFSSSVSPSLHKEKNTLYRSPQFNLQAMTSEVIRAKFGIQKLPKKG